MKREPLMTDVLVVDDDYDIRDTMSEILADHGYEVATVANGQEALDWLHTNAAPSVVLLDWMMPICDGAGFREKQLADPSLAKIPVVLVSAAPTIDRLAAGMEAYLKKPVDLSTLLGIVARFVEERPASA
jgi:CheY-like chemotaxis protein